MISAKLYSLPKARQRAGRKKSAKEAAGAGAAMLAAQALGQRIEPLPWARRYSPGEDCRDYGEKYARYRAVEKKLWGRDGA